MHKMTEIKCKLEDIILEAVENPENANVEELGAVTDMLKDVAMAMYYCHSIEEHNHSSSIGEYIEHLGEDVTEMIENASPQDKAALQMKLTALAAKIK